MFFFWLMCWQSIHNFLKWVGASGVAQNTGMWGMSSFTIWNEYTCLEALYTHISPWVSHHVPQEWEVIDTILIGVGVLESCGVEAHGSLSAADLRNVNMMSYGYVTRWDRQVAGNLLNHALATICGCTYVYIFGQGVNFHGLFIEIGP